MHLSIHLSDMFSCVSVERCNFSSRDSIRFRVPPAMVLGRETRVLNLLRARTACLVCAVQTEGLESTTKRLLSMPINKYIHA